MQLKRPIVETIFFLTVMVFLIAKIFSLPTIYPALAIGAFSFHKGLFTELKRQKFVIFAWLGLLFYTLLVLPVFTNPLVTAAFVVTPLYALSIVGLKQHYSLNKDFLINGFLILALFFALLLCIGVSLHFEEIAPLLSWQQVALEIKRFDVSLRKILFDSFLPWANDLGTQTALISLLGILLITLTLLKPTSLKGYVALVILFALNIIALSRAPVLSAIGILTISALAKSNSRARWITAACFFIPVVLLSLDFRTLNGRHVIWTTLFTNLNWWGHGLGSAALATEKISQGVNQNPIITYPHNIHLELMYDWGLILYSIALLGVLFYLLRSAKPRTAFIIFFVFFLNYTIYSPWSVWFLFFALWQDSQPYTEMTQKMPADSKIKLQRYLPLPNLIQRWK